MSDTHETYMQRCLDLARNGLGSVAPNPMVGSVIVHHDRIIGEGFHTGFGKPHAEVEAISQVRDQALLEESTLYVNLEPCSHHGKTPPCTHLILEKKIPRVVIGQSDPHETAGGGIEQLRNHGVEVITGILESESRRLNCRFNTFHEKMRPYLILKWAQTTDGFVDTLRDDLENMKPAWITNEACRRLVHKWRTEEQSILAGSRTILKDNPQLNVRAWKGRNPLRVTIDRNGRLLTGYRQDDEYRLPATGNLQTATVSFLDQSVPTLIYTCQDNHGGPNLDFVRISPDEPVWKQVMADMFKRNIQSVLIEGGPTLLETLIHEDLWDEARVFIGPGWFGKGVRAPHFPFHASGQGEVGNSRLMQFYRSDSEGARSAGRNMDKL